MAVKASATITLSFMVDIKATYRYYLLQPSTLAKPAKPTIYPPQGSTYAPLFTNLVDSSVDDNGNIYNGIGYKDGYRWSSSGKKETTQNGGRITGWMPFDSTAVYRIKNMSTGTQGYVNGGYFVYKKSDGSLVAASIELYGTHDSATDTFTFTVPDSAVVSFRISAYTAAEAPIITCNEEIEYGIISHAWDDIEPSYTSGSTNSLYCVDCTVFTDDSFVYSNVSLSTSYEAAKEAYNKAQAAQDSANDAQNKAGEAYDKAEDAAKVATNYMDFEDGVGLIVGDMTSGSLTKNVLIDSDSVDIRDGDKTLASFGANTIELGKESNDAIISMRNNTAAISTFNRGAKDYTQFVAYGNMDVSGLSNISTENYKRGGVQTTIESEAYTIWKDIEGYTWSGLSNYTWADLHGDAFLEDRSLYFETSLYAENIDGTTSTGYAMSKISLKTKREPVDGGADKLKSEIIIDTDAMKINSPLNVMSDTNIDGSITAKNNLYASSCRVSSDCSWIGRYRFNSGWIGLYSEPDNASANSNRLGWMGYDNSTSNFSINNGAGGYNYINKAWTVSSDRRLKDNIEDIPEVFVDIWKELQPKVFKWNELNYDSEHKYQFGLIAQDVIDTFEKYSLDWRDYNIVTPFKMMDDDTEYFSITYDNYHMLTSLALKDAVKKHDLLQSEIDVLKVQNESLQNQINELKTLVESVLKK